MATTSGVPTRRHFLSLATAGSAALAGAVLAGPGPERAEAQAGESIVGTWFSVVQRVSGGPLINLQTFNADGTANATSTDHPTRSPAHGAWTRTGDRQYAYTTLRLLFDKDGTYTGIQQIRGDLTVSQDGGSYTSQAQADFYDAAGNLMMSNPTTGQATRVAITPRTDPAPPTIYPSAGGS
jgi:hypothetical protein